MVFQVHGHVQVTNQDLQAEQRATNSTNCQRARRIQCVSHTTKTHQRPVYEATQTITELKSGSEGRDRQRAIKLFNNLKTEAFHLENI